MTTSEPNATLMDVVEKCLKDADFFRRLARNMTQTLEQAGVRLSGDDLRSLERMLNGVNDNNVQTIIDLVNRFRTLNPGDWDPGWPRGWVLRA